MDTTLDGAILEAQLGRPQRAVSLPVARCHFGLPVVAKVPPSLEGGEPFPTRYWLTCALAHRRIARLEASGAVRAWDARLAEEPALAARMEAVHARYRAERDADFVEGAGYAPSGGVAGSRGGTKCLHAHFADHLATADNPIGRDTAEKVLPLQCEMPCVLACGDTDAGARRARKNPDWRDPA